MDLDFEGYPQAAGHLIDCFLSHSRDEEMLVLLDFYKCYRACVRAKVNCFCLQESDVGTGRRNKLLREIRRYLKLAYRYAVQFTRPTVWVVCGLPASGKTTMAEMIAKILGLGIIGSDVVRKKLFRKPLYESQDLFFEKGMYSKESTALVYGKILMMAQEEIEKRCSIILDATFSTCHQRDEARRLARDMDANIIFVECAASKETLKKRLSMRDASDSISDARLPHFKQLAARFEPISELPDEMRICIDTEKPPEEGMRQILSLDYAFLANQTERAIKQWESSSLNIADLA
jgi:predicted kinase